MDAGGKWTNLTANIAGLPPNSWVSWLEPSRHDAGTAYAAFDRHTFGDMTPWVYKTTDYGKTWKRIVSPDQGVRGYAHVIREDVVAKDLLFVGTELGLWISVDGGVKWAEFKGSDFPSVAVRDLAIQARDNDLVIGTHGRGIWIIDDITPLRAMTPTNLEKQIAFLPGRQVQQRMGATGGWVEGDAQFVGGNPPGGAVLTYYLRSRHIYGNIKLEILDAAGKVLDTMVPTKRRGINRISWNMRVKGPRVPKAVQAAFGASQGPRVLPGTYTARITRGSEVVEQKFTIALDRRAPYDNAARKAQFDAVMSGHKLFEDMSKLGDQIDGLRAAVTEREKAVPETEDLGKKLRELGKKVDEAKKLIVATTEGGAITGEERIREHLEIVYGQLNSWEGRPAKYQVDRIDALAKELADARKIVEALSTKDARALDELLKAKKLAPIPGLTEVVAPVKPLDPIAMTCIRTLGGECGDKNVITRRKARIQQRGLK
jgi:hypothetical protein